MGEKKGKMVAGIGEPSKSINALRGPECVLACRYDFSFHVCDSGKNRVAR